MGYEVVKQKGRQTVIRISRDWASSGIDLVVNKRRQVLEVSGWYDTFAGIEGAEIPLGELLELFGKERKNA